MEARPIARHIRKDAALLNLPDFTYIFVRRMGDGASGTLLSVEEGKFTWVVCFGKEAALRNELSPATL